MLGSRDRLAKVSLAALAVVATLSIGVHGVTANSPLKLHGQIHIDGNNGFTPANGVVSGTGTVSDPYVIAGWEFNLTLDRQIMFPHGMLDVWNTTAHFVIQGIRAADHGAGGWPPTWAIQLVNVTGAQISNSLVSSTYSDGILISKSSSVLVEANGFSNQHGGVSAYSSTNVTIRGNSFMGGGITLQSSSRVIIHHNNFWRAEGKDYTPAANRWDNGYPSGGNYWSKRGLEDFVDRCSGPKQDICTGPDGIADNPHFVTDSCPCPTGVDHYPLMDPYGLAPDNVPPTWPFW